MLDFITGTHSRSKAGVEPSRFENIQDLLCYLPESLVEGTGITTSSPIFSMGPNQHNNDTFSKLPTVTVHILLSWIPSDDIQQLRLESRSIASRSHPGSLPPSFWGSRFIPDFEMGFALPKRTDGYHDWRSLYFRIKRGGGGIVLAVS